MNQNDSFLSPDGPSDMKVANSRNIVKNVCQGRRTTVKTSKYGKLPPSQKEIVSYYTEPDVGTIVGYALYNRLRLTTQVGKSIKVYSSRQTPPTETVPSVWVTYCNLDFTPEVKAVIHMMDVLQHFGEIQDLDYARFLEFSREFAQQYSDETFDQVNQALRYQEKDIAFLREVLHYHGIQHNLDRTLPSLSEYKHPRMVKILKQKNPG